MDLKKRLAGLDRLTRRPDGRGEGEPAPSRTGDPDLAASLGLTERSGPGGRTWIAEHADPVRPPRDPLPDMTGFFTRPGPGGLTSRDILFLDTETTGLAGGTGTIPFLVGVSWWDGPILRTRQYFLSGPGREGPLLADLEDLARGFRVVATFNGASFDLPLLRTRARLERRGDPLAGLFCWDLLVPARRLWGRRLPDCRQQTLEREILGRTRGEGDIDGNRIPRTWFDFLASGRTDEMATVLTHNHRDMLGMADLLAEVMRAAFSLDDLGAHPATGWRTPWARGRICEARRDHAAAGRWLSRAVAATDGDRRGRDVPPTFFRDALRILKRTGDWGRVERTIAAGFAHGVEGAWLHREAAILFEHRLARLDLALQHARLSGEDGRVERIVRKLARPAGQDGGGPEGGGP